MKQLPSYFVMGNVMWGIAVFCQMFVLWSHGLGRWQVILTTVAFSISYIQAGGMLERQRVDDEVKELNEVFEQSKKFNRLVEKELQEIQLFKLQLEKEKIKNGLLCPGTDTRKS